MKLLRKKEGFTLIEILFVIIVIAILAAIAIMRITTTMQTARVNACAAQCAVINTQLEQFMLDTGAYPADAAAFTAFLSNVSYFPDGVPACQPTSNITYTVPPTARATCSL
ncbi:MAG TPA: prepilin-type N-terminal cleavage/methylation domain-containing protein [Nitrospirae bacterium]|nr:prepilin-type N-terminal cleavage/methylation domain-containing protein [Nitrospirota bacterium]